MASKEPVIEDSTNQAHFIKPITTKKSKLKGGGLNEINENTDDYRDEVLHNIKNL